MPTEVSLGQRIGAREAPGFRRRAQGATWPKRSKEQMARWWLIPREDDEVGSGGVDGQTVGEPAVATSEPMRKRRLELGEEATKDGWVDSYPGRKRVRRKWRRAGVGCENQSDGKAASPHAALDAWPHGPVSNPQPAAPCSPPSVTPLGVPPMVTEEAKDTGEVGSQ
ncbi:Os08g0285500 [Oryza sativa Japonica Group]|uniref:Os08g0285500 protein n=2 Tax=Oryza TaxID=4527 RepID=C7J675_ORYSJ|nr:hypothetical protein OsJ_26746 [Oryza sativa Japonica Group]BAD01320.1 hypothetical protein [Oryza sativa Japonica Group]BAD01452.1 hypothetical protein [Oryza sativa Japonica Group]BAH94226.1 Os08g0285500 [Oryza sativa Japonica Group]|eukprot:NP_001175498.1 Os08g0285500 [Oryza sativa Japonica Group]